jgi:hypothetical protein
MAWKRSGLAFLAGVGVLLIALDFREQGWAALNWWTAVGAVGMAVLFAKSLKA